MIALDTNLLIYVHREERPTCSNVADVRLLGESSAHLDILDRLLTTGRVTGPKVHDARIAAICIGHGVSELWTADRDFSYFPELRTRNPLVGRD